MNNLSRKPVVIVGPTASGKSSVAMAVAQAESSNVSQVHIVAVDAMQVYRDMNIGTAKPTKQDQALVPHHCIDLVDSHERFTVAEFKKSATDSLEKIDSHNGRALLVAGTGLYLTAVIDELVLPGEFLDIRATLEEEPDTTKLFARLAELDSVAAEKWSSRIDVALFVRSKFASAVVDHSAVLVLARTRIPRTESFRSACDGVASDLRNASPIGFMR